MREWIPISTSPKGRLALAAVKEFGARPFGDVTVGELAAAADVTTGAIYHHFGSKLGLYAFVRRDVERRLIDRMEGAAEFARQHAVRAALQVGFDFATGKDSYTCSPSRLSALKTICWWKCSTSSLRRARSRWVRCSRLAGGRHCSRWLVAYP